MSSFDCLSHNDSLNSQSCAMIGSQYCKACVPPKEWDKIRETEDNFIHTSNGQQYNTI